ncbi:MAG: SseB family protein [Oscillospiraceae bacterium]|nr:SseB family protein [Oscillospiraceae bacterium]
MNNLQELIKQYNTDKSKSTYDEIIKAFMSQQTLWAAFSPPTNNYYIGRDDKKPCMYIFSEKKYLDMFQGFLVKYLYYIVPLENTLEHRMIMFGDLFRSGIEVIVVDNGQENNISLNLTDLVPEPDFDGIAQTERPLLNPDLVLNASMFFQCLAAKKPQTDMEEKMFAKICTSRFLMPADESILKFETSEDGTKNVNIDEETIKKLPVITNVNNQDYFPFFTDWNELRRYDRAKKFAGNIVSFSDLKYFAGLKSGIVINPFGFNFIIDKKMIGVVDTVGHKYLEEHKDITEAASAADEQPEEETAKKPEGKKLFGLFGKK